MGDALLTKTRFQYGRQCLRRLWLDCHRREEAAPSSPATLALFASGAEIGALARECFPGGVAVAARPWEHDAAVARTNELMQDPHVPAIFEAAFLHGGLRLRSDVLARGRRGRWRLIEVKSSIQPKEEHYWDVAVQRHALAGCGVPIESVCIMHVNRDYVYDGLRHDPGRLLVVTDVTDQVDALLPEVDGLLAEQRRTVADPQEPAIPPGLQCFSPCDCPFFHHCAPDKPRHWIAYLPGISPERFAALAALGIEDISDIPDDFPLTSRQRWVRDATRAAAPSVLRGAAAAVARIAPPLLFFDFETIAPAIPRYAGTRPYQATPFQWSLHVVESDGTITHEEFLHDRDDDPRRPLAEAALEALERDGAIVAYHAKFEIGIIRQLADDLPDLAPRLLPLVDRIVDLLPVVRDSYYHPDMLGSYSLKSVVPALVPDCAYDDLAIQEGATASVIYVEMLAEADPSRRARLRRDLLDYCKRDTWAMVRIWQELRHLAGLEAPGTG